MKKFMALIMIATLLFIAINITAGYCQKTEQTEVKSAPKKVDSKTRSKNLVEKGNALLRNGELGKAALMFGKAAKIDPKNAEAWIGKAKILLAKDKLVFALGTYRKALQHLPGSPVIWFNYGVAQGKAGRYGDALSSFDRAIKYDGNYADAWKYKGYTFVKLYRVEEAIPALEQARSLDPNDVGTKFFLGISYFYMGKKGEGKALIDEALKAKPQLKSKIPKKMKESLGI
ncbi:MAG: tetratricopeptide repeat protein [Candidatus Eremiobacteraeota bacterium]|nr:tetratricopeptide repeat protein [Candidatus Eremiobacteraeota bacterium]